MNLRRVWCLIFLCGLSTASRASDWQLMWSDEFNSPGLPDPAKWGYETGFIRNHELQFYTARRTENARVENGMLVIEGRKERFKDPADGTGTTSRHRRTDANYTSASLNTEGKASFLYGRIEVRAKLPHGRGVWPAIWMMGTNRVDVGWPHCGEVDIMEFVGKEPDYIYGTMHYTKDGKHASKGGKIKTAAPYDDFHVYAVEWSSEKMDFYFDDNKYFSFNLDDAGVGPDNPFRKPQYLLLNLALGGDWGGPMDDAALPQPYLIDYVRVSKRM